MDVKRGRDDNEGEAAPTREQKQKTEEYVHRFMSVGPDMRRKLLATIRDHIMLWNIYRWSSKAFRKWCDTKNEEGKNAWTHLLKEHFQVTPIEIAPFENHRWLYFSYAMCGGKEGFISPYDHRLIHKSTPSTPNTPGDYFNYANFERYNQLNRESLNGTFSFVLYHKDDNNGEMTSTCALINEKLGARFLNFTSAVIRRGGTSTITTRFTPGIDRSMVLDFQIPHITTNMTLLRNAFELEAQSVSFLYVLFECGFGLKVWAHPTGFSPQAVLIQCGACGAPESQVTRQCGGCDAVQYCSEECAERHWTSGGHHAECK